MADASARRTLDKAWKLILLNQFHDILPGTSINWVYKDAERQHKQVRELLRPLIDRGMRADGIHDHGGIYIPPGVAHGFASLTDMTITYLVDGYYNPADELGVAWDDPAVGADWGVTDPILSGRDQANPARNALEPALQPHYGLRT